MKNAFAALLFVVLCDSLQAQSSESDRSETPEPVLLNFAEQHTIHSGLMMQDRSFNISLPKGFHESSAQHTYPVLLLLEGEFFQLVSGVVLHLSSVERMPETLVVSLVDEHVTPTVYTNGSNFWPMESLPGNDPSTFTAHLKKELFPYLKENFRANDFHMVMGVSYSSLYVLHALVKESALFDAHYRELSSEYGFAILPRADRWNSVNRLSWIGPYLLRNRETAEAIEVIERWVEYRPKSLAALDQLARAYEADEDYEMSLSTLQKAQELAVALDSKEAAKYTSEISRIEKRQNDLCELRPL